MCFHCTAKRTKAGEGFEGSVIANQFACLCHDALMRTTLDIPEPMLRELKTRAASTGQSLKALLNDLIERAMRLPDASAQAGAGLASTLPVLVRLQSPMPLAQQGLASNAQLADQLLDDDIAKLKRIGFIP